MQKSNNDKMVEILRQLKPEMHGAVVGAMESRGVKYGLNYGVAVPVIRRVAGKYAPDHALAEYLFRQDVRELKLAAVYIDDPEQVTAEQMNRWADAMPADEVMEHAAMNIFYASPDADDVIREWLAGGERSRWKGALQMVGRRAMRGMVTEREGERYLSGIGKLIAAREVPQRAVVFALQRLAGVSPGLKDKVLAFAEQLKKHENPSLREIGEEIEAFLAY